MTCAVNESEVELVHSNNCGANIINEFKLFVTLASNVDDALIGIDVVNVDVIVDSQLIVCDAKLGAVNKVVQVAVQTFCNVVLCIAFKTLKSADVIVETHSIFCASSIPQVKFVFNETFVLKFA
jgi:hypothetical protein